MTFIPNWEEFEKSAEVLYLRDPINTRYSVKYSHSKGVFVVKITDNKKAQKLLDRIQNVFYHYLEGFLRIRIGYILYRYSHGTGNSTGETAPQCLQYKTEIQQDVRKIDQFISNLIRHMASNDH